MKIFILSGKAGSGKDMLGKYMKTTFDFRGEETCILHFTTPLYEYAKNYFSWDGDMGEKPREFLQTLGIDIIQKKLGMKYFLADRLIDDIKILSRFFKVFIITDGRLISEFTRVKEAFPNTKIIHVIRDNYENGLTDEEKNHITEKELEEYDKYDYVINNTTKDELFLEAVKIMDEEKEMI